MVASDACCYGHVLLLGLHVDTTAYVFLDVLMLSKSWKSHGRSFEEHVIWPGVKTERILATETLNILLGELNMFENIHELILYSQSAINK